jgi:hypothetical protein
MALNLSLSYQQQNDNKAIVLTDTTDDFASDGGTTVIAAGVTVAAEFYEIVTQSTLDFTTDGAPDSNVGTRYVATGGATLGAGDSIKTVTPTYAEITAATLDTTITGVDNTPTAKTQVDLYTEFGPFASATDTVYTITAALLGDTSGSVLLDGLYALTYKLSYTGDGIINTKTDTLTVTILVYGVVKVATYQKLRAIPVSYSCQDGSVKPTIAEADLCGAYLSGIENSAYVAKTEELINMLIVLDNIILNGSYITW